MKANLSSKPRELGSVLMIVLFTSMAIGIVLASVLTLVSSRYKLSLRSLGWNAALPVAEAGLEEALSHLHTDSNNPTANGWTATTMSGHPVHTKTRFLPDGSYYYVAIHKASSTNPVVYSSGFTPSPLEANQYISRLIEVDASNPWNLFTKAIAATGSITLNGTTPEVDSFDSRIGGYDTTTNRHANGGLATDSMASGAIAIGNGNVYGTVATGPGGTVALGPNGSVGDEAWHAGYDGVQPGWTNDTMNVAFPTNAPPRGGPFAAPAVTEGVMYLGNGTSQLSSFHESGNSTPIVVTGHATLYVTGDFSLAGQSQVIIKPGASLTLIIGGSASLAGGGVVNGTGNAANFSLVGLSSNTEITYTGTSEFVGTVNAPQAAFKLAGTVDAYGAAVVGSAVIDGGIRFHYDESLAKATGFVVTYWKEL